MNEQTKMSAKGQVVIPSATRERWKFAPGSQIEVVETAAGVLLKPVKPIPLKSFEAVSAAIEKLNPYRGPPISEDSWKQRLVEKLRAEWRQPG